MKKSTQYFDKTVMGGICFATVTSTCNITTVKWIWHTITSTSTTGKHTWYNITSTSTISKTSLSTTTAINPNLVNLANPIHLVTVK
jgi:hypothetical protein